MKERKGVEKKKDEESRRKNGSAVGQARREQIRRVESLRDRGHAKVNRKSTVNKEVVQDNAR